MGEITMHRAEGGSVWKVMLGVAVVLTVLAVVTFALSPGWWRLVAVASPASQILLWLMLRPGRVEVSDAGLHVVGANGNALRAHDLEWSQIRRIRRQQWSLPLLIDLASGKTVRLPQLDREGQDAVLAAWEGRMHLAAAEPDRLADGQPDRSEPSR